MPVIRCTDQNRVNIFHVEELTIVFETPGTQVTLLLFGFGPVEVVVAQVTKSDGFLVTMLFGAGALLRQSPSLRSGLTLIGILLFLLLVPARGCTIRASIMAASFLAGPIIKRWSPRVNTLAFAALVILCIRPGELFDAGFQLSFAAVGGIILFLPLLEYVRHNLSKYRGRSIRFLTRYIVVPFIISCAVCIMTLPLTSYHFGMMAIGAPIYNLIAVPLLGFIFTGAWIVTVLSVVTPWLAGLAADGVNGFIELFKWVAHLFSIDAPVWSGHLAPISIGIILTTVIWLAVSRRRPAVKVIITVLIALSVFVWHAQIPGTTRFQAWFLDVGNGDAQVWRFPNGRIAVIDGGSASRTDRKGTVVRFLGYYGCEKIDLIVATHPEADHIGGLIELIDTYPVKLAITGPSTSTTLIYALLCSSSAAKELHWRRLFDGAEVRGLGHSYKLTVLGPPLGSEIWKANDASVVLLLEIGLKHDRELRLLTTGDIERRGEIALIIRGGIEADLLKVPHHGSETSSSPEFIAAVAPAKAVITRSERGNHRRQLKNDTVINRLISNDIQVIVTGREGAVLFEASASAEGAEFRQIDWRNPPLWRWLLGMN